MQVSAVLAVLIYVAAECTSYYNVATTNEFWCAIEVILDGASYLIMAPACLWLWCKCPGKMCGSSAKAYLTVMCVVCVAYPFYNFAVDAPMYIARYHDDQAHHKQYLTFWKGIEDAATHRVVTHQLADWKQDIFWMTTYFTAGAWSGVLLMFAPRLSPPSDRGGDEKEPAALPAV